MVNRTSTWIASANTLAISLFACLYPVAAVSQPLEDERRALEQVRLYSKAWMGRDAATVASLTHPILIIREGGLEKYRASVDVIFHAVQDADWTSGVELIGTPSEEFTLGKSRMFGVPAIRKVSGFAVTPMVYVVVSYDAGKTWAVFAATCTDEHWLKALIPGYNGSPDILGIGNPAVTQVAKGDEHFDEDAFLRGTQFAKAADASGSVGAMNVQR